MELCRVWLAGRGIGSDGRRLLRGNQPQQPPLVARHAVQHEFARSLDDVMRRRTLQWLEPDRGRIVARFMAANMGKELGWSAARTSEEIEYYDTAVREEESLLARVWDGHQEPSHRARRGAG